MMIGSEMAKYRIDDLVREAEAFRRSKASRAARSTEGKELVRRIASAAASLVLWPVKH